MAPLQEAGRLGAVRRPFPSRVHHTPENRALLRRLAHACRAYPLVVAIRPRAWDRPQGYEFLQALGVGFCPSDQPALAYAIGLPQVVTSALG
jgi:uncharacterized protein YecE (DUF72 family)